MGSNREDLQGKLKHIETRIYHLQMQRRLKESIEAKMEKREAEMEALENERCRYDLSQRKARIEPLKNELKSAFPDLNKLIYMEKQQLNTQWRLLYPFESPASRRHLPCTRYYWKP